MTIKGVEGPFKKGSPPWVSFVFGLIVGLVLGYIFWSTGTKPSEPQEQISTNTNVVSPEDKKPSEEGAPEAVVATEEPTATVEETEQPAERPVLAVSGPMDHLANEIDLWPARLFFISVPGQSLDASSRTFLRTFKPGGVLLQEDNIKNANQLKELVKQIKDAVGLGTENADLPLIAVSYENPAFRKALVSDLATLRSLGESRDIEKGRQLGRTLASACKKVGIAVVLGPRFDVLKTEKTIVSLDDCFGSDHLVVATMALSVAQGMMEEGVIPIAITFPGYAAAERDPLEPVLVLSRDKTVIAQILFPYMQAVHWGIPGILVGHVATPVLDKDAPRRPASLSPVLIGGHLRERWGFDGVVVADDLFAEAVTASRSPERAAIEAISSGADALILTERDTIKIRTVSKAIEQSLQEGKIPRDNVLKSIRRLDKWQEWLKAPVGLTQPLPDLTAKGSESVTSEPEPSQVTSEAQKAGAEPEPPQSREHVVAGGENLTKIAAKYGVTVENLKQWNNLSDTKLMVGQKLKILGPNSSEASKPFEQTTGDKQAPQPSETQAVSSEVPPEEKPAVPAESSAIAPAEPNVPQSGTSESPAPGAAPVQDAGVPQPEPQPSAESASVTSEVPPANDKNNQVTEYEEYVVQPGDTIFGLSKRFNVKREDLLSLNNMTDQDKLFFGKKIKIPKSPAVSNESERDKGAE
ncbi:MAG TPA: glycoside hydrolase family 3 N-terminal domain-containing protein [Candidatus Hydrogenedentes bacterium]|nr:glycoside hydrolase family 3 N-terminal domain-containing protein [Candidatus Hydrogenedentota bacterium]HOL75697.1 glycoside hydrolase family 3 N-terminal domain-containing protein [Candidatus Hydrogenedentota bacterium]HPO84310.1 glycoside hydrolase family 3 N-terminal domain-containing protein [Candidatus Hydrogenedentota bacterium]